MRYAPWLLVLLCLWPWGGAPRSSQPLSERLIGPAAGLTASVGWMRFDWLVREGRYEAAYAAADRALELDPSSPQGWVYYATHLATFRASAETEPDPERRRRWIQAGIDLLDRGEARCDHPGELALSSGLLLYMVARMEEDPQTAIGWPGGAEAARVASRIALDRATAHGVRPGDVAPIEHEH